MEKRKKSVGFESDGEMQGKWFGKQDQDFCFGYVNCKITETLVILDRQLNMNGELEISI